MSPRWRRGLALDGAVTEALPMAQDRGPVGCDLAIDDDKIYQLRIDVFARAEVQHLYRLHDLFPLYRRELRDSGRLLEPVEYDVPLQARPEIASKGLLQLAHADAEKLAPFARHHCGRLPVLKKHRALAEAIAWPKPRKLRAALKGAAGLDSAALARSELALLHKVESRGGIAFGDDPGARLEDLRHEGLTYSVFLPGRQVAEDPHRVEKLPVLGIIPLRALLHHLPKSDAAGPPEGAIAYRSHRGGARTVVKQCDAAKGLARGHGVDDASADAHLQPTSLRDEEHAPDLALLYNEVTRPELEVLHGLQDGANVVFLQQSAYLVLLHRSLDERSGLGVLGELPAVIRQVRLQSLDHGGTSPADALSGRTLPRSEAYAFLISGRLYCICRHRHLLSR
mmetsp:Transcript_1466/g.3352  ORF Transcript_1466/g.3352 Transcript_1466/m.3352 type:complete len:396 (-) Transcript_1466:114-1301(-)